MKTFIIGFSLLMLLLTSCKKTKTKEVIGKWKLIEQYIDPGDGSGTFAPVESDLTLEFLEKGVLKTNGPICYFNSQSGTQEFEEKYTATHIEMLSCFESDIQLLYEIIDGYLIIHYKCDEGCHQKYEKQ